MPNVAKKSDWKTKSFPKSNRVIPLNVSFSLEEYKELQEGFVPRQMEDKWFIYFEDNNLYCHRSWTGHCIYIGKFKQVNDEYILYEVLVNNCKQYEPQSDFHEVKLFFNLIEGIGSSMTSDFLRPSVITNPSEILRDDFGNYYRDLPKKLQSHYNDLLNGEKLKLNDNIITKAIIQRLKIYYETQDDIVEFLDKRSVSPASDFFVETVLFYLKLLIEQLNKKLEAKSEVRFNTKNGYMKPDISIWKNDEVVAIIECKTNLGFRRNEWKSDFESRTKELQTAFPKAKAFLLVLSSKNWSGFDENDGKVGKHHFALSKLSLRKIKDTPLDEVVENRIEKLFGQILKLG